MRLSCHNLVRLPSSRLISANVYSFRHVRTIQSIVMDIDSSSPAKRKDRSLSPSENPGPTKKQRQDDKNPSSIISPAPTSGVRNNNPKKSKLSKRTVGKLIHPEEGTPDDVLWHEIRETLGEHVVDDAVASKVDLVSPLNFGDVLELEVDKLSSSGESISRLPDSDRSWVVLTPFALPGEKIRVKIVRNGRMVSHADLLEVIQPNPTLRDMSRVKCQYFGKCAGCQYQMLDYSTQLQFKQSVIVNAYRFYSSLPSTSVPAPLPTIGSPLQYGYRTKITPHFEAPPKNLKAKEDWKVWIGFDEKNRRKVLDIEECPIATPVINRALGPIRKEVQDNISTYKKGATLLMRDSLQEHNADGSGSEEKHICIRDHKAIVRERVGASLFEFPANSFFQNNNSVLVPLTDYVRHAILAPPTGHTGRTPTHLVDTYCGSGLFAITLAASFERVVGIEISEESIRYARHNVSLNEIPESKCSFLPGKSEKIFEVVQDFPPEETVIVIDPPRKGCDDAFIEQLLRFGAGTVVYVSCNVHTQARDVGKIIKGSAAGNNDGGGGGGGYVLESVRGFDLFPQTAHVESVAVLRRI